MAYRRMLHKTISVSEEVNKLPICARLLYTWMIPHADDEGRIKGEPTFIKVTVVPYTNWSPKLITSYLNQMKDIGLIYYWQQNDHWYIEFPKWFDYQSLRKDRVSPSKLPSYTHTDDNQLETISQPDDNQQSTQDNISEIKPIEVKTSESKSNQPVADYMNQEGVAKVVNPRTFFPENESHTAAKEVWGKLEPYNPLAFQTTYLKWADKGLPVQLFYQFASEINQDNTIKNKGAIFNTKAENYFLDKDLEKCPTF